MDEPEPVTTNRQGEQREWSTEPMQPTLKVGEPNMTTFDGEEEATESGRGYRLGLAVAAAVLAVAGCASNGGGNTSEPTSTFNGSGCTYDGPTEFDLDSEVMFTFVNASDVADDDVGLGVAAVPDGTTADEIHRDGIFNVGASFYDVDDESTDSDGDHQFTVTLNQAGSTALNCFDMTPGGQGVDYPTLVTVTQ